MQCFCSRAGLGCAMLFLTVLLFAAPNTAQAQYIPCNIVNLAVFHPYSVPAGSTLTVSSFMTVACDTSAPYILRVDLVSQSNGNVISSVKQPFYPPTPSGISEPINNTVTAPSAIGPWVLQVQAYIINGFNGQVAGSSQYQFVVDITQFAPQTATTTVFSATSSTQITLSVISSQSTPSQLIQSTQTSTASPVQVTSAYATTQSSNPTTLPLIGGLVLVLIAAAAVFFIMMWRRKPASH